MNASSVSRIIKANTNISRSETARGRVSEVVSEGFKVEQNGSMVEVFYIASSLRYSDKGWQEFDEKQTGALYLIAKVLKRKGYSVQRNETNLTIKGAN